MTIDRWMNIVLGVMLAAVVLFGRLESRLMDASWMGIFRAEVQRTQDQLLRNQQELARTLQELQQKMTRLEKVKDTP